MECFVCGRTEDVDYPYGDDYEYWVCDVCEPLFSHTYNQECDLGASVDDAVVFARDVVLKEGWA